MLLDHDLTAAALIGIVWHKLLLGKSSQVGVGKGGETLNYKLESGLLKINFIFPASYSLLFQNVYSNVSIHTVSSWQHRLTTPSPPLLLYCALF